MKVLVLNSGSSSIKYQLFQSDNWQVLAAGAVNRIGEARGDFQGRWLDKGGWEHCFELALPVAHHGAELELMAARLRASGVLADLGELVAIGHRVVHGGETFQRPTRVDEGVIAVIRDMIPLAPCITLPTWRVSR